jgi:hypothetical protein
MDKEADDWYNQEGPNITEWEWNQMSLVDNSFKTAFEERFCTEEVREDFADKFRKCIQGGTQTVREYAYKITELGKRAEATNKELKNQFITGLQKAIQMHVRMAEPGNFNEAIEFADKIEKAINKTQAKPQAHIFEAQTESTDNILIAEINSIKKELEQVKNTKQVLVKPERTCALCYERNPTHTTENCPSRSINRPITGRKCFNCQSTEHMAKDCPKGNNNYNRGSNNYNNNRTSNNNNYRNNNNNYKEGVKCYNCDRMGHFAKDCTRPKKQFNNEKPRNNWEQKCEYCGRTGHEKGGCFKYQKDVREFEAARNQRQNTGVFNTIIEPNTTQYLTSQIPQMQQVPQMQQMFVPNQNTNMQNIPSNTNNNNSNNNENKNKTNEQVETLVNAMTSAFKNLNY